MNNPVLAAISIQRRMISIAIFRRTHLEGVFFRHLPLDSDRAVGTVSSLVAQTLDRYRPDFIALTAPSERTKRRLLQMQATVWNMIRKAGLPIMEVPDQALFAAYGHPVLRTKKQLQDVGRNIWPILNEATATAAPVNAVMLGLYVQIERLFNSDDGIA